MIIRESIENEGVVIAHINSKGEVIIVGEKE